MSGNRLRVVVLLRRQIVLPRTNRPMRTAKAERRNPKKSDLASDISSYCEFATSFSRVFFLNISSSLFLAFIGYFALGAYYNYSTYGATGADLIP